MILFTKDIPENTLLTAYNNRVVRFSSDLDLTPLYCEVSGLGFFAKIYPSPDNSFRIDMKDYVASVINTNRFEDTVQSELISNDSDSFTYDATQGCYIEGAVIFKITFVDLTFESASRNVEFFTGVYQIDQFKNQEIPEALNYIILSPVKKRSDSSVDLKFWEGYPFEFSFYTKFPNEDFRILNTTNGIDSNFRSKGKITSLFLSDGRTDVSIEDLLPLSNGLNVLNIFNGSANQNVNINIYKTESDCGIYVKWLNSLGRWNYWLLNKINSKDLSTKYIGEVNNDFNNLEDTISPTLQIGKTSSVTVRCNAKSLTASERDVFIGLLTSPKIYYFTGERFSRSSANDWIEVTLKNSSFRIDDTNKKKFTFLIDIELPTQNNQSL